MSTENSADLPIIHSACKASPFGKGVKVNASIPPPSYSRGREWWFSHTSGHLLCSRLCARDGGPWRRNPQGPTCKAAHCPGRGRQAQCPTRKVRLWPALAKRGSKGSGEYNWGQICPPWKGHGELNGIGTTGSLLGLQDR